MDIRAEDITDNWPARAEQTRDNPDEVISVFDGDILKAEISGGTAPKLAMYKAETARIYLRYTAATAYAVCLYTEGDATRVFYGRAGGYGYDRVAAACDGMPVGTVNGELIVLTNHCGLDRLGGDPTGGNARQFLAHRGGYLPAPLFTW